MDFYAGMPPLGTIGCTMEIQAVISCGTPTIMNSLGPMGNSLNNQKPCTKV